MHGSESMRTQHAAYAIGKGLKVKGMKCGPHGAIEEQVGLNTSLTSVQSS
jgi:hypothetical protein